jgi:peroxiredoxin
MDTVIKSGQEAPQFRLQNLDGEVCSLTGDKGQITLLNFWSAECDWCSQVDEELTSYLLEWKERVRVWWIASNANEPRALIKEVASSRKLTLPNPQNSLRSVLLDVDQHVADLYGAQTTPHFFLVDEKGILVYQGAWDNRNFRQRVATQKYVPQVIEALLNGQPLLYTSTQPYGCVLVRYAR